MYLDSVVIHATFHVSRLRPHERNDDLLFPHRNARAVYDFGFEQTTEWFVEEITGHRWSTNAHVEFEVRWNLGDTTWESVKDVRGLESYENYLQVQGAKTWRSLPKH